MAVKDILLVWKGKDDISKENLQFLSTRTLPVEFPLSKEDKMIIRDLKDTANAITCAGIAANQIGYNKKIFIGVTNTEQSDYEIIINPEIIKFSKNSIVPGLYHTNDNKIDQLKLKLKITERNDEACLSIPGFHMFFNRYDKIK